MVDLAFENAGQVGLISDKKPFELMPEAWSYSHNVRFNLQGASKIKGHTLVYDTTMLHAPYWLFPWKSTTGFSWIYAGLTRIGRIVGAAHTDVTRFTTSLGDDDYAAVADTRWSGIMLGDLPILTYSGEVDFPQSYNFSNNRFEDLPNWQTDTYADIVTVVNRFVVALRIKKPSVIFNPRMVKWSEPADPGTYPSSWDETDPTKLTGEVTLAETPGPIMAAALFSKAMLIYKDDSVIAMHFVGGQSVFAFPTIFSDFGAISQNAIGTLEKSHFVVTKGDVIVHNTETWQSVIDQRNRNFLFDSLDVSLVWKLQVNVFPKEKEVWINYADSTSQGNLNKTLIWNYRDNTWSHRELQEFVFLAVDYVDTSGLDNTYNGVTGTFDDEITFFNEGASSPVFTDILAADSVNTKLFKLNDSTQFDGVNIPCLAERTGLAIVGRDRQGEWKTDLNSRKFIRRLFLKMIASGPVNVSVGGQETPNGAVTWEPAISFDPNFESYIDPLLNTKFFAFKVESNSDVSWTLYGYTLSLDIIGEAPE